MHYVFENEIKTILGNKTKFSGFSVQTLVTDIEPNYTDISPDFRNNGYKCKKQQ